MAKKVILVSLFVLLGIPREVYSQECLQLKMIYGDWYISSKSSNDSILIFHSKRSDYGKDNDTNEQVTFVKNEKGVLSQIKYGNFAHCVSPRLISFLGSEKWILNKDKKGIQQIFYDGKYEWLYVRHYNIVDLNKKKMELRLKKEAFNEYWVE
ncbi:hypothetical protein [Croceitalea sp. P059]|uniref:hypothetical protein n=1 Tax=Croceitalea sp. P059 TaxID=3075601 RepID=UPI002884A7F8|nr:hypothetical protein [Croceitalea sp. P059]MDT0538764.1 hypothetical protein [Croceitalea sp. P059]